MIRLPAGRLAAVLAAVGVAVVDQGCLSCLWPLGPAPPEATFAAVIDAYEPGKALAIALEALGLRHPYFEDVSAPVVKAAAAMDDDTTAFKQVLEVIAGTDLSGRDGTGEPADLLGTTYQLLRTHGSKNQLAAFFTPPPLARLLGAVNEASQGDALYEPTLGTGALFLGARESLTRRGIDPWTCGWFGMDIDSLAVALAGMNAIAWGLGPHVWLHAGNSLTDHFVTPTGCPVRFQVVLSNPPFSGSVRGGQGAGGEQRIVADPAGRRAQMGLSYPWGR
jgi:type I restriction-modification system DNA methylase subunit